MKRTLVYVITVLILQSCYFDNEEDLYGPVTCDLSNITYSSDVSIIINSSCATTGCHVPGGTGTGDFTNYTGLKAKVDNGTFETRVLNEKTMPPSTPLSQCELEILQNWLDNGALNN